MKINIFVLIILLFLLSTCKKTSKTSSVSLTASSNFYSFKMGSLNYSSNTIYGQNYDISPDTLLNINTTKNDTMSGGFLLKIKGLGTFTHDSSSANEYNRFIFSFLGPTHTPITFYSKSGSVTITKFNNATTSYGGTFSGIMYLSTNPSYTLPLINGEFYYKY